MSDNMTTRSNSLEELRRLEALWRRCAKGWFVTHWILLGTNVAAAIAMLAGARVPELGALVPYATIYVPVSTLVIATLKPSNRATTFIVAYRMLYFALLRQRISNLPTEKVITIAEQAEALIYKGGYMPNLSDSPNSDRSALSGPR